MHHYGLLLGPPRVPGPPGSWCGMTPPSPGRPVSERLARSAGVVGLLFLVAAIRISVIVFPRR